MSKRVVYWDNLKYLLITFVVLGHFIDPLTGGNNYARRVFLFVYSFHVPLFMFVSGVFYSSSNLKSKVLFYICTGFIMKLLNLISDVFLRGINPQFDLLGDKAAPWYLFALAAFLLLRYMIRDKNKWFFLGFAILLGCLAGYDSSLGDKFYLSRIIVFFPFYLAGSMIDRNCLPRRIKSHWACYAGAVCVMIILFYACNYHVSELYKYRHLMTGRNPFSDSVVSYGFYARLGCYAVSSVVGLAVMILTPNGRIPYISSWGRYTLCVFFWHKFFYFLLARFFPISDWFARGVIGQLTYMLTAVVLTAVLSAVGWFAFPVQHIKKLCYMSCLEQGGLKSIE